MRFAPLFAAFTIAAGLVGLSTVTGQPPPGKTDKSPAAELAKFRGAWSVTKVDLPPGVDDIPADELAKVLKAVTVSATDNRVTINVRMPGQQQPDDYLLLKVDPAQTPAHLDLTEATEKFEPRQTFSTTRKKGEKSVPLPIRFLKGIYKFEGDGLVLALPTDLELGRPTAFKTVAPKNQKGSRTDQAIVALVYLSKKK
ncbi:MAG TPA: hypothetical protein VD866_21780 [Urbifossiella sp.]|nr:hypothetical protein [Urbifossiella sp.]